MKKSVKNTVCLISLCLAIALSVSSSVFASSDRGSAIYRDKITGAFWASTNGHAGLVVQHYIVEDHQDCITHMTGDGYAESCTLSEFMAEGDENAATEYSLAVPLETMTDTEIGYICAKAAELVDADFNYTFLRQLNYSASRFGTGRVLVPHITALRCDGLTEYCYEFYNKRIYGSNSGWDVSIATQASYNEHSGVQITPYKQMNNYMDVYYPE